jgi:hypothetical protein
MSEYRVETPESWPPLARVTLVLCIDCLAGMGGECHTPGCTLWMQPGPTFPIEQRCTTFAPLSDEDGEP